MNQMNLLSAFSNIPVIFFLNNSFISVRLRALVSCEQFIQDSIEAEEFIKHDEQCKRLRQESLVKRYVHVKRLLSLRLSPHPIARNKKL